MNRALLSSSRLEWCTPQGFFEDLNKGFNFTLDVAATKDNALCEHFYTAEDDGLSKSWTPPYGGSVFCNPPYGREIGKWVRKAYNEARRGVTIVMLLPARTDTSYFHDYIYNHAEIRFIRGRLRFTDGLGREYWPAPFPSMVVIYNSHMAKEECINHTIIRRHGE